MTNDFPGRVGSDNAPDRNIWLQYGIAGGNNTPPAIPVNNLLPVQPQPLKNSMVMPEAYHKAIGKTKSATIAINIVASIAIALVFIVSVLIGGTAGGVLTFVLALVPLTAVILSTVWIGKWDPEPFHIRLISFLWGAIGSVILTFILAPLFYIIFPIAGESVALNATLQAPVVEEFAKGIFVLVIALFFKKYMDGPIDAVVYMVLVAAGFAFTENILYFIQSLASVGVVGLGFTFVMRGLMSPFAHALFSLPMGILIGIAVKNRASKLGIIGFALLGYIPAMILHGLWNGSASFIPDTLVWLIFYFVVEMPLFIGAIFLITWLRKQEALRTYKRLTEYAWEGHFAPNDVETLGTWEGRRYSRSWAKTKSPHALYIVNKLNKDVVDLAAVKEEKELGKITEDLLRKEEILLNQVKHDKNLILQV